MVAPPEVKNFQFTQYKNTHLIIHKEEYSDAECTYKIESKTPDLDILGACVEI
jgi:hypothetical protein